MRSQLGRPVPEEMVRRGGGDCEVQFRGDRSQVPFRLRKAQSPSMGNLGIAPFSESQDEMVFGEGGKQHAGPPCVSACELLLWLSEVGWLGRASWRAGRAV